MFTEAFALLSVADLERSLRFYRDGLGFVETYRFPDDGQAVFVGLELRDSKLGIGQAEPGDLPLPPPAGDRFSLCVYAEDCDAAVAALRGDGVTIVSDPEDQPWGERMARVVDPDGNPVLIMTAGTEP